MTKMARFKNGLSVSRKFPLLLPVRHLKQERRGERLRATVYSPVFLSVKTPRAWHPQLCKWEQLPSLLCTSILLI